MKESELVRKIKNNIYEGYIGAAGYEGKAMSRDRAIRDSEIIFLRIVPILGITRLSQDETLIKQVFGGFERGYFGDLKLCPKSIIQCFHKRKSEEQQIEHRKIKEDPGSLYNPRNGVSAEVLIILKYKIPEMLSGRSRMPIGEWKKCFDGSKKFHYNFDVLPSKSKKSKKSYFLDCVKVYQKRRSVDDIIIFLESLPEATQNKTPNKLRLKDSHTI